MKNANERKLHKISAKINTYRKLNKNKYKNRYFYFFIYFYFVMLKKVFNYI